MTVKYHPDGKELWTARYDGPASGHDVPQDVVSDAAGNVYVTGYSQGLEAGSDFATVKYDPTGRELWVARYDGTSSGSDSAGALALDPLGSVLIIGRSDGPGSESDYVTVKYHPEDGTELWTARYDGPASGDDAPQDVVSDAAGNVYVTGYSQGLGGTDQGRGTGWDLATVKYDPMGRELWVARYDGPYGKRDEATKIVVDSVGAVFVGGRSYMDTQRGGDMVTVKYDPQGNLLWAASYDGARSSSELYRVSEIVADMTVDAAGNLYVTGPSEGEVRGTAPTVTDSDFLTLKYDAEGNLLWAARFGAPGYSFDEAYSLAVDAHGDVYVAGKSYLPSTGGDFVTVKYNGEGLQTWAVRYGGASDVFDSPAALVLDSAGSVYVLGTSESLRGDFDLTTVKFTMAD